MFMSGLEIDKDIDFEKNNINNGVLSVDDDIGDSRSKNNGFRVPKIIPVIVILLIIIFGVVFFTFNNPEIVDFSNFVDLSQSEEEDDQIIDYGPVTCNIVNEIKGDKKVVVASSGRDEDSFVSVIEPRPDRYLVYWDGRFVEARSFPSFDLKQFVVERNVSHLFFYLDSNLDDFDIQKELIEFELDGANVTCNIIQDNTIPISELINFE
jgi:hypothetical protein